MTIKFWTFVLLTCLLAVSVKAQTKPAAACSARLDAVITAPKKHKLVYEDNEVRILQVICPPGNEEPVHTHQYKSTMWFTQSAHFIYYTYVPDTHNQLVKKDSVEVKGFPDEALNKGEMVEPEGPHSVKNYQY